MSMLKMRHLIHGRSTPLWSSNFNFNINIVLCVCATLYSTATKTYCHFTASVVALSSIQTGFEKRKVVVLKWRMLRQCLLADERRKWWKLYSMSVLRYIAPSPLLWVQKNWFWEQKSGGINTYIAGLGFTEQKSAYFLTYLKFQRLFREVMNQYQACLYLSECIFHCGFKYACEILQFRHFDKFC